jgi:hypothetical protein
VTVRSSIKMARSSFSAPDVSSTSALGSVVEQSPTKGPFCDEHVFPEWLLGPAWRPHWLRRASSVMITMFRQLEQRVGKLADGGGEFLNGSEDHAAVRVDAVA